MSNLNNNNDENLFTQMFGLESEQPKTEAPTMPITEAPTQPMTSPVQVVPTTPQTEPQTQPMPQNELLAAFNFNSNPTQQQTVIQPVQKQNEVMTLAPTSAQELEQRTTPPTEPEPVFEETRFNPNAISSTPDNYVPTNFSKYDGTEIYEENTTEGKYFMKLALVFIGVAAVVGGWFFFYTNVLKEENDKIAEQAEKLNNQKEEQKEEEEIPEEPVIYPIEFDEEMNFYHSLTTNKNELKQTEPFTPEKSTGVIVCTNLKPYSFGSGAIINEYYLYYEDYKLKKTIHNEISAYTSQEDYNTMALGYSSLQQMWADKEGIKVKVNAYPEQLAFHTIAYFNLAYGNYFVTDHDSNIYYRLRYDYNENVKDTMGTLLGVEIDNLVCSSVITTSEAASNNEI